MTITSPPRRPIGFEPTEPHRFWIIDQRFLPHQLVIEFIESHVQAAAAIKEMRVRGAPLIGATAAWGLYLAALEALKAKDPRNFLETAGAALKATRPTAVNLAWAVNRGLEALLKLEDPNEWGPAALRFADNVTEEDARQCRAIGEHGLALLRDIAAKKPAGQPVQVLTHCNAGRIACIEYGTATAPLYLAQETGLPVHVWVDETRPRNQGALTAWELTEAGIDCTVIVDNAGGLLMQRGMVDVVIVGADRVSRKGDAANKIGTYLKALAATDCGVPFYVALPSSTFDWNLMEAQTEIEIEERDADEVLSIQGMDNLNRLNKVRVFADPVKAFNPGFDVTPARLITGLITERGICAANVDDIRLLFPEFF